MKKVRKDIAFREKIFRGGKLEDIIFYFKEQGEELVLKSKVAKPEEEAIYLAQARVYFENAERLATELRYDKTKLNDEGQLRLFA